jgi:predicted dehydrogenase
MEDTTRSRRQFISTSARGALAASVTLPAAQWNAVFGANDRVRLGVIGTGDRGRSVMSSFQKAGVEVIALCDAYDDYLNRALTMTEGKAKNYADYQRVLEVKDVDAVLIATPDHWHARMAIDACQAGKDVYIEKPLTYSIEEGHDIIKAARASRNVFQVGLQQRSGEHYAEAKREYFDSGKIGKVTLVRTWWHGNGYHLRKPNFTAKPAGLDWKKFLGRLPYREFNAHQFYNWRSYLDFGGGQITDLFTHWIDVVHWFVGEDLPISGSAAGGVYNYNDGRTAPDTINVLLEYPGRWSATFDATLVPGARGAAIEFMGTEGRLEISRNGYTYSPRGRDAQPVTRQTTEDLTLSHVKNFLECIKSRKTPNSDVVSGHRSALASHLGKIAYVKKRRLTFDPAAEKRV